VGGAGKKRGLVIRGMLAGGKPSWARAGVEHVWDYVWEKMGGRKKKAAFEESPTSSRLGRKKELKNREREKITEITEANPIDGGNGGILKKKFLNTRD